MRYIYSFLFVWMIGLSAWAQSGNDYDPKNPADPDVPPTPPVYYTLTMEAAPRYGGSVNNSQVSATEGYEVYCRANAKMGYAFRQWMVGDSLVSTDDSFYFKMPAEDVVLIAYFDYVGYDPENPADPEAPGDGPVVEKTYNVTVYANPSVGGYFNSSSFWMKEGEITKIYAYPQNGYRFESWMQGSTVVSTDNPLTIKMGTQDVSYKAVFTYNPEDPIDPFANTFDSETGAVVIDNFVPGTLGNTISNTIGGSEYRSAVKSIKVVGRLTSSDFGFAYRYPNCVTIDLSRTTGYVEVPSYSFEDAAALKTVYLPTNVENIGRYAFARCAALESLYIYSPTPPTMEEEVFYNASTTFVVYVPSGAIELYRAADGWKELNIQPLDGEEKSFTINFPSEVVMSEYKNMTLELVNVQSGQVYKYLVTDRRTYTFYALMKNTVYDVYLKNTMGEVLAELSNVMLEEDDVTVSFNSIKKMHDVALSVQTPEGDDVTSMVDITWYDAQGTYLRQGNMLRDIIGGRKLQYRIKINDELAMDYVQPATMVVCVASEEGAVYKLTRIEKVEFTGRVIDASSKRGIRNATVSLSQTVNKTNNKTQTVKTDDKGYYSFTAYNAPCKLAVTAYDYVTQARMIDTLTVVGGKVEIPNVMLAPVIGATINIGHTYTESVAEGDTPEILNWYRDYDNIAYDVYNVTLAKQIAQVSYRYPQLVLLDDAQVGDSLRITATSKKDAFMPVVVGATIDSTNVMDAIFDIKQLGQINATYKTTENQSVAGILYSSEGQLLNKYTYSQGELKIDELKDGIYYLVTMGKNELYNSQYNISRLLSLGLMEGVDYIKEKIVVESGLISTISYDEVPFFDENKFSYIEMGNSSLYASQSSIVVGNYVTLVGSLDVIGDLNVLSDLKLMVDLPSTAAFVEGSVMIGERVTSNYSFEEGSLTIPLDGYRKGDKIKFCVIPTEEGEYAPNALVSFYANDRQAFLPIGNSFYEVEALTINVPSITASKTITVSGVVAEPESVVEVYDNDVLIANVTPLANGSWEAKCELNEAYNLSTHSIYAKVKTKMGLELISETKQVVYDINMIVPEKVTMLYYNPEYVGQYNIVFDLINRTVSPKYYYFFPYKSYPNWRGSGTEPKEFTFIADLSNNDSIAVNGVTIRVYTDNGHWRNLEAQYNTSMNRWVAVSQFVEEEAPVGIDVEIDAKSDIMVDDRILESFYDFAKDDISTYNNYVEECDSLINDINARLSLGTSIDVERIMNDYYSILGVVNNNNEDESNEHCKYLESLGEDALLKYIDGVIAELDSAYNELMSNKILFSIDDLANGSIYGEINFEEEGIFDVKTEYIGNVTESELLCQGFAELKTVGGNKVYYLVERSRVEMYDFTNDMHISYSNAEIAAMVRLLGVGTRAIDVNEWRTIITSATNIVHAIEEKYHKIKELIDTRIKQNDEAIDFLRKYTNKACKEFAPLAKLYQRHGFPSIEYRLTKLNQRIGVFQKGIENLTANSQLLNGLKVVGKSLTKGLNIVAIINDGYQAITDMNDWLVLGLDLREKAEKCENYRNLYNQAQMQGYSILTGYVSILTLDLTSVASVLGALGTAGTSLILSVGSSVASSVGGIYIPRNSANYKREIRAEIPNVPKCTDDDKCSKCGKNPCECPDKCSKCGKNPCVCPPPPNTIDVQHDPAGYVYEGVSSNRVEGVMASCYYKETEEDEYGIIQDRAVLWDASEFDQENPLFTDENGMYQWFVPRGLWQVKFEKEGYETTYSEWLPVPPPQLEVNVPIVQNRQPEVANVHAYKDGIEIEFDKYMQPAMLNTDNIFVVQDGEKVAGTVAMLNEEIAYRDSSVKYVSKVRFVFDEPITAEEVALTVSNRVKSYAGIQMQDTYTQTFDIEQEIMGIVADSLVTVFYGGNHTLAVKVEPAEAAAGKTLLVNSLSPMILTVDVDSIKLDSNGEAVVTVTGELPGSGVISYSLVGYDHKATTIVKVEYDNTEMTANPTASIPSGTTVVKGTEVTLSCATEGAIIYYTLDGSCPCDESTQIRYDGTPIVINNNTELRMMAVAEGRYESDVVVYYYYVEGDVQMTANPTASIASGTTVAKGTEVTLSCATEGAVIYYTLDGSSPDDAATQIRYDGTPIVINETTTLRMMAVAEGYEKSYIVEYRYYVEDEEEPKPMEVTIHQKWDDVLICDNSSNEFVAYQWYKNDMPIAGETGQYYSEVGGLNGSYHVMAQHINGDWGMSNVVVCAGRAEIGLKVTPSIVKKNEKCVVSIHRAEGNEEVVYLNVYNAMGQMVRRLEMTGSSVELELGNPGPYFIKAVGLKNNVESEKIMVIE